MWQQQLNTCKGIKLPKPRHCRQQGRHCSRGKSPELLSTTRSRMGRIDTRSILYTKPLQPPISPEKRGIYVIFLQGVLAPRLSWIYCFVFCLFVCECFWFLMETSRSLPPSPPPPPPPPEMGSRLSSIQRRRVHKVTPVSTQGVAPLTPPEKKILILGLTFPLVFTPPGPVHSGGF